MNVANQSIEGLSRNSVVLAGPELSRKTIAKDGLSGELGKDSDAQRHPCELEGVSDNIKVSNHEDQRDDGSICDSGGSYGGLSVYRVDKGIKDLELTRVVP